MTNSLSGPVVPALNTRASLHVGAPGLFVLLLGSLVLLTGLTPPEPAANDVVALMISSGADGLSLPQWLAGATMIGTALVAMRLCRRMHWLRVLMVAGGPSRGTPPQSAR